MILWLFLLACGPPPVTTSVEAQAETALRAFLDAVHGGDCDKVMAQAPDIETLEDCHTYVETIQARDLRVGEITSVQQDGRKPEVYIVNASMTETKGTRNLVWGLKQSPDGWIISK